MNRAAPSLVDAFRDLIAQQLGLAFEPGQLRPLLERRSAKHGQSCEAYLSSLHQGIPALERGELAKALTTPETYFFRSRAQFSAFAELVLAERLRSGMPRQPVRVLSAGCATGEEAYTIAITALEAGFQPERSIFIRAVDVSPSAIERATIGVFAPWALRETSPEAAAKWFQNDGRVVRLHPALEGSVHFEVRNLASPDPELWSAGAYDAIFCRNVMMYFTPAQARELTSRLAASLAEGGYLFLGHAETLRGLSLDFEVLHTHGTFIYQLKTSPTRSLWHTEEVSRSESSGSPIVWTDAIRDASERVMALNRPPPEPTPVQPSRDPSRYLDATLDLMRQERFDQAFDLIEQAELDGDAGSQHLLLKAVLLTHTGAFLEVERACERLLTLGEYDAAAHYLLALCLEHQEKPQAAVLHDEVASYLDPGFAMPRLHLGLLARAAGERVRARRELGQALILLEREDVQRIALFGGGFGREALLAICRAELSACGGAA